MVQKDFKLSGLSIGRFVSVVRNFQASGKTRPFILGIFTFLLFLWAFRDFFSTGMLAYGDQAPFPQTAQQAFDVFLSSWHPMSLGSTAQYPLNFFLVGMTIIFAGGNAVLAQKIWLFISMPLSFASMYFFSRRFSDSIIVRWFSSFVYSVNPLTIGPPYIGGATGVLFYYAFLPLLFEFLIRLFASSRHTARNFLFFTLLFTLSGGLVTSFYIFSLFASLLVYVLLRRRIRFALSRLALLGGSIFLFFGLTLPSNYLGLPVLARYLPSYLNSGQPPIPVSDLVAGIAYTYGQQTAHNLLNFGATALPFPGYSSGSSWWSALGVIYPILAFSSLFFVRGHRNAKFIAWFSTYSLATLLFIWATKLGPGLEVFRGFPFLFTFSNPSGLLLMVMLGYAPLIAIALDRILAKCRGHFIAIGEAFEYRRIVRTSILVAAICLLLAGSYVWPFFTGNMGFNSIGVPTSKLAIPAVYYEASAWINEHRANDESFRTLWVPLDYQTQLDVRWLDVSTLTFPLGIGQYLTIPVTRYVGFVFNALATNKTARIGSLLGPLNVKYIIVNLESSETGPPTASGFLNYGEPFLFGSPYAYASILDSQRDLKLIEKSTTFLVYLNLNFQQRISVFDGLQYVASPGSRDGYTSDLETLGYLSNFPGYDSSRQMLILEDSLPQAQRSWFMQRADTLIINPENTGVAPSFQIGSSQAIFQAIRTQSPLGTWTPRSGQWVVQGGGLVGTSPDMPGTWSYADIYYEHFNVSDFTVATQFYIYSPVADSAYQQPGIFLRQSTGGFYLVEVEPDANRIAIYRSGLPQPVATAPASIQPNTWYNLTASISGQAGNVRLVVHLNTTLFIDVLDTNSPNAALEGYVGLQSKGYHTSVVAFKDTEISTPDGRVLYQGNVPWPYTIANAEIQTPRADDYSIFAYAPGNGSLAFNIGTLSINSNQIANGWFNSPPVHLEQGTYNLTINYGNRSLSQSEFMQTHIALVSSNFANNNRVSQPPPEWSFQQLSSTSYALTLETQGPAYVQLSEMYAPEWNAIVNGVEEVHYASGSFLNGFYVEGGGSYHVIIQYQGQNTKNLVTIIWIATWSFAIASSLYILKPWSRLRSRPLERYSVSCDS